MADPKCVDGQVCYAVRRVEQWDRLRPAVGGSAVGGGTGSIVSAGSTESVQGLVSALVVGPTTGEQHRVGLAGCLS